MMTEYREELYEFDDTHECCECKGNAEYCVDGRYYCEECVLGAVLDAFDIEVDKHAFDYKYDGEYYERSDLLDELIRRNEIHKI